MFIQRIRLCAPIRWARWLFMKASKKFPAFPCAGILAIRPIAGEPHTVYLQLAGSVYDWDSLSDESVP